MESATLRAATCAAPSLSAPTTRMCATLVVPSESSAICSDSDMQTSLSAAVSDSSEGVRRPPTRQHQHGVVGRRAAVHRHDVEGDVDRGAQRRAQQLGRRDGVRRAERQHRGHVRRQHGGALGHGAHREPGPLDECRLRHGVGRHDGPGRGRRRLRVPTTGTPRCRPGAAPPVPCGNGMPISPVWQTRISCSLRVDPLGHGAAQAGRSVTARLSGRRVGVARREDHPGGPPARSPRGGPD